MGAYRLVVRQGHACVCFFPAATGSAGGFPGGSFSSHRSPHTFPELQGEGGEAASAAAAACGELSANHHSHPNLVYVSCLVITLPAFLSLAPAVQVPQCPAALCAPFHRALQRWGKGQGGRSLSPADSSGRAGSLSPQRPSCPCSGSAPQPFGATPAPTRATCQDPWMNPGVGETTSPA